MWGGWVARRGTQPLMLANKVGVTNLVNVVDIPYTLTIFARN